jgi:hypothetical protein
MPLYRAEVVQQQITLHKPRLHDKSQVLYLPFDNDDGNYAKDRSGYNNHGVIYGATHVAGKVGIALSFNGTSNYVDVGFGRFETLTSGTVMLWVNPSVIGGSLAAFSHYKDVNNRCTFFQFGGGAMALRIVALGENHLIQSNDLITLNHWSHLAFTFGAGGMKMYINSVLQTQTDATTLSWNDIGAGAYNTIGCQGPAGAFFPGIIDEVRVYNRALNQAEIQHLMNMRNI